ncbi:hypothetical protein SUGI_0290680 [Cryptomeria japonica]|nr:hypothetical protein SUGI_0290680 [Cryptomeria japonica]
MPDSDRESTINDLHHNVLTLTDTSNALNLIDEVMPIIHPELIEWNQPNPPCLDFFQNDEAIIDFLELRDNLPSGDHKAGFSIELNSAAYFGADAKPFSCKNITIKHGSSGENHTVALFDPTKVKRKSVSNGENLFEAPEDEGFDILLANAQQERSTILIEETKEYNVGTPENPHLIHLASLFTPEEQPKFIEFFQKHQINFAWSYADMPGLDPDLVMHHLIVAEGAKPVKQKLRKMHPQIAVLVKTELKKLLDVGFIRPIDYAEWISNIVPIGKPKGGIRICTDFRDLNKACPKDDFPLPNIDIIVDLTVPDMPCFHSWMTFQDTIK